MQAELVDQAKRGDREAFDSLARLTGDRCMAIAFRILRDFDHADDAVQAAMVTAWREIRALRDPALFEPWLHRILTHACYAEARRRRRWSEGIRLLQVEPAHGSDPYLNVDDRDQLERAFQRLTVEQRAVLVFHHYLGLPLPEVAQRIGIPLGTVKSRMHHAKQALRAALEADARASSDTPGANRMTTRHDLDKQLSAFLREGPTDLPDPSFDAVRDRIEQTRQRAVIGSLGVPDMNKFLAVGLGVAAVVLAGYIGVQLLGGPPPGGPPVETTSPVESAAEPSSPADGSLPEGPYALSVDADGGLDITVSIPAPGWYGEPGEGILVKNENADPPDGSGLIVFDEGDLFVYGDPCEWTWTAPDTPATTLDELVAALAAQASRDALGAGGYHAGRVRREVDHPPRAG